MAVRYHGCTCHLKYSALKKSSSDNLNNTTTNSNSNDTKVDANKPNNSTNNKEDSNAIGTNDKEEEKTAQPWYFHVVASFILVIHGLTFLVPHDPETEDTDMMRIIGKWFGFDWDWMKHFTPYAQVCN